MGSVRVKLNLRGVRELLNDDSVVAECMRRADAICLQANDNVESREDQRWPNTYEKDPHVAIESVTSKGNRCAVVIARTNEAKAMQAKHSTLTKALDAGRG